MYESLKEDLWENLESEMNATMLAQLYAFSDVHDERFTKNFS